MQILNFKLESLTKTTWKGKRKRNGEELMASSLDQTHLIFWFRFGCRGSVVDF
jgi:hypothetical protein